MVSKLRELMEGRNGVDQLGVAVFTSAVIVNFVGSLTRRPTLSLLSAVLFGAAVSRTLSKKLDKRQTENYQFIRIWSDIKSELYRLRVRLRTSREYKFFNCPDCKSKLRVKRGKGKVQITCPRCGLRFSRKL